MGKVKIILWAALVIIVVGAGYEYGHITGAISAQQDIDQFAYLRITRTVRALNVIDALQKKMIVSKSAGDSAAQTVDGILTDFMQISTHLSGEQKAAFCRHVREPLVLPLLKSAELYGDPKTIWDQAGVKGVVQFCR